MYFNIYKKSETEFNHNEFIISHVISAKITEEINGIFNLDMECLLTEPNLDVIEVGSVIKCPMPDDREDQLFRITDVNKTFNSVVIKAAAIGIADLSVNFIPDTNVVGMNKLDAVNHLLKGTLQEHRFKAVGEADDELNNLRIVRYNPIQAIFGSEDNTMVNRFGGEYQFDNFKILVSKELGRDNGVIIAHKKNITGIEITIDDSTLATRIIPQGRDELLLPEYYIDSPKINDYEKVYHKHVSFDIGVVEPEPEGDTEGGEDSELPEVREGEEIITEEQAFELLREATHKLFTEEKIDTLFFNYKINFIELSKTDQYKNYAALEKVNLGDTVKVLAENLGTTLSGRVYKYGYDVLKGVYDEIEIGSKKPDISSAISNTNQQISSVKNMIEFGISSMNERLNSKLTITENKIMTEVTDKDNKLQSQIEQQAGLIESKVSADEVSSIISQSPEAVKIAFNNGSNYVSIDNDGITTAHDDGSYTFMGRWGLEHKKAGATRPYKYINYAVKISQLNNGVWTKINLPKDFQYKNLDDDFVITTWTGDIDSNVNAEKHKDAIRRLFVQVGEWNATECTLMVRVCLQKIGIATLTYFGWDSQTTSSGNPIGEGAVDVIILAQM